MYRERIVHVATIGYQVKEYLSVSLAKAITCIESSLLIYLSLTFRGFGIVKNTLDTAMSINVRDCFGYIS